jgi:hypothetical protein
MGASSSGVDMIHGQEGNGRKRGRPRRARRLAWVVLLFAVGCHGIGGGTSSAPQAEPLAANNDPLLGLTPAPGPASPGSTGTSVSGAGWSTGVRAIPTETSGGPNAVLAGTPPSSGLRIPAGNTTGGGSSTSSGGPWRGSDSGAVLKAPEIVGGPAPLPPATSGFGPAPAGAPVTLTSGGAITTMEQAYAALKQRGVTWSNLQQLDRGEWKFICAIPNPQNATNQTKYVGSAPGENGLAAIRAILDQIDRDAHQ